MDFLSGGSEDYNDRVLPYNDNSLLPDPARQLIPLLNGGSGGASAESALDIRRLIRKYWLFLLALIILGSAAGFASVVMSSPRYKTRLLLEVLASNGLPRNSGVDNANFEATEVNIQTQISILRSGTFLKR